MAVEGRITYREYNDKENIKRYVTEIVATNVIMLGEKKKVALASILSIAPRVWLLDEPTAGLDPRTTAWLVEFLKAQSIGGSTVVIATHDLLLGTLIDLFPDDIRNYRFEADITDNELTFSYRLRPGIAQNMNACFLMKKMGIAVAD